MDESVVEWKQLKRWNLCISQSVGVMFRQAESNLGELDLCHYAIMPSQFEFFNLNSSKFNQNNSTEFHKHNFINSLKFTYK